MLLSIMKNMLIGLINMIELVDCPCCKTKPTMYKQGILIKHDEVKYSYYYKCFTCGRRTPLRYSTIEDAAKVWNRLADGDAFESYNSNLTYSCPLDMPKSRDGR